MYAFWFIKGVKLASQEFISLLILNQKTPKQKDFYKLYAIHKFGAKKNCMGEDKLVLAFMNLKNKAIDLGTMPNS